MKKTPPHASAELTAEIETRGFGDRVQRALLLVLEGEAYRHAAELAGLRSHQDVARAAKSVPGLEEAHLWAWRMSWGKQFPAMWRQHVRHLDEAA